VNFVFFVVHSVTLVCFACIGVVLT
jgi:hypothetical protein